MEDDDEFCDLYSDVLPPVRSSPLPDSRPSDDDEILYGSNSKNSLKLDELDDKNMKLDE